MIIDTMKKNNLLITLLSFIYYLRYLIFIFLLSITLLLTIPKLFNNVNKFNEINAHLENQYGFIIKDPKEVKYKIFPQPSLNIKNPNFIFVDESSSLQIKKLNIFIPLKNFYISEKINLKRIKFEGDFLGNNFDGYYLPKKDINLLFLRFENFGVKAKVFFDKKIKFPQSSGKIKLNILNDNLLINFEYEKNLKFQESIYKNKNFHINFSGKLIFEPFFYFKTVAVIKKINLQNLKIKKIYNLIVNEISDKKLNGELDISFLKEKKIGNTKIKIDDLKLKFDNGDIITNNSVFLFSNLKITTNMYLKKYPSHKDLTYDLLIETDNLNKFYEDIGFEKKENLKKINALIRGNINLNANKYYFDEITINKKSFEKEKLAKLKNYFNKNMINYLNGEFNEENIILFLNDLIKFI